MACRSFLAFAFAASIASVTAQSANTHGKSDGDILALGRAKWYTFYTKAEGSESTHAMAWADRIYATALQRRTDRLAAKKGARDLRQIKSLRAACAEFTTLNVKIGEALSGGGTIWVVTTAALTANQEEALDAVVRSRRSPASVVVSTVVKAMDRTEREIRQQIAEFEKKPGEDGASFQEQLTNLNKARAAYGTVVTIASKLPRAASDHILTFCLSTAKVTLS